MRDFGVGVVCRESAIVCVDMLRFLEWRWMVTSVVDDMLVLLNAVMICSTVSLSRQIAGALQVRISRLVGRVMIRELMQRICELI